MEAWGRLCKVERDSRENGVYTDSGSRFYLFFRHEYTSCYAARILITSQMEVNLIFTIILWDFVHFGFWIFKFQSVFFRSLKSLSRSLGLLFGAWYKIEQYSGTCGGAQWLTLWLLGPTGEKGRGQGTHFKNTPWIPNFLSLGPRPLKFLHLPKCHRLVTKSTVYHVYGNSRLQTLTVTKLTQIKEVWTPECVLLTASHAAILMRLEYLIMSGLQRSSRHKRRGRLSRRCKDGPWEGEGSEKHRQVFMSS